MEIQERWQHQEEAFKFAMEHPATMLDMDMGTGKTRVAIDVAFARENVHRILVVCPKVAVPVWRENLEKFAQQDWECWDFQKGTVPKKTEDLKKWVEGVKSDKQWVIINYDSVWRSPFGDFVLRHHFDMVILDESHRAKAAGSKVSKFLAILGRRVRYKLCLSGTPMANSPLDVYGQYRFLDPLIFGTNHSNFLQEYAIFGGPDRQFVVGYKNQKELERKFHTIAYSCKMSSVAERIKLPDHLPPIRRPVQLPAQDMRAMVDLSKNFRAYTGSGTVTVRNVLVKLLRIQQITSGFCMVQDSPGAPSHLEVLNTAKLDALVDVVQDLGNQERVVVFCVFRHDLRSVREAARKLGRPYFEVSGDENTLPAWKETAGALLGVQIQAGSEAIDLTLSNFAVYFSIPRFGAYDQSKSRLYRPGQLRPVTFIHLIAEHTIDESMYKLLQRKEDAIDAIKNGTFDYGYLH